MKKIRMVAVLCAMILLVGCATSTPQEYEGLSLPTTEEMQNMNSNENLVSPGGANELYNGGAIFANRELAEEKGLTNYKRTQQEKEQDEKEEQEAKKKEPQEILPPESFSQYAILNEKYFYIQALYQKTVEEYFAQMLNLAEIDKEIANNRRGYYPKEKKYQNYFQSHSMFGLEYIYLRNTVYIERLSQEDIDMLTKYYEGQKTEVTEELRDLVKRTYAYILAPVNTEIVGSEAYNEKYSYDMPSEQVFSLDTIIFGISVTLPYDEAEENQLVDEEKYEKDCLYLQEKLAPKFEKKLAGKLGEGSTCGFIVYS